MLKELNSAVSFFPSDLHVLNTPELYQIYSKMMVPAFLWGGRAGKGKGNGAGKQTPFWYSAPGNHRCFMEVNVLRTLC